MLNKLIVILFFLMSSSLLCAQVDSISLCGVKFKHSYVIKDSSLVTNVIIQNNSGKGIYFPYAYHSYAFDKNLYTSLGIRMSKLTGPPPLGTNITLMHIPADESIEINLPCSSKLLAPRKVYFVIDFIFDDAVSKRKIKKKTNDNEYCILIDVYLKKHTYLSYSYGFNTFSSMTSFK